MRGDLLETVDPANGKYAGFLVDREFVAFAFDFFAVKESDDEHVMTFPVIGP
ncbi:hypothetical protein MSIMFB_03655 [Mycobacterium simulans]|uniref:Uncharacterized protein n=1 Tax=Mycobacterium simulans TaxID=627089 RepID=A0A7Z7IP08_9MYCO|nr:hypothetical protein MSIMFB_03655 [Mycobacterium simulans]